MKVYIYMINKCCILLFKGTKAARKLLQDFEEQKEAFVGRVAKTIEENDIPQSIVINWDQSG